MAKTRTFEEIQRVSENDSNSFFKLENNRDVATVRFMYNSINDISGYVVHPVKVLSSNGKPFTQSVACLRDYSDPLDVCPFCKARMVTSTKVVVPLYNEDLKQVQVWERGKTFYQTLRSYCERYPNIVSHTFEIERQGEKGDMKTSYGIFEKSQDNTRLEDLPPVDNPQGGIVDKTAEEMNVYLQTGSFPNHNEPTVTRRETSVPVRRTPVQGINDTDVPF